MKQRAALITDPRAAEALAQPLRRRVLQELRAPSSAATVARSLGLSRQQVNYHVKALAELGLIRPSGERRKGHLIEKLYESVAGSFVISPRLTCSDGSRRAALDEQISLRRLVELGEQLQQDAAGLLDRAAFDGAEIPSASVDAELRFRSEAERSAFMNDYLEALGPLLSRHGAREGDRYRLALAIYPDPEEDRSWEDSSKTDSKPSS